HSATHTAISSRRPKEPGGLVNVRSRARTFAAAAVSAGGNFSSNARKSSNGRPVAVAIMGLASASLARGQQLLYNGCPFPAASSSPRMQDGGSTSGQFGAFADELKAALLFLTRLPPSLVG